MKKDVSERIALSVEETADLLGISVPSAYNLVRTENFPARRVNGRWLVSKKGLEEWLNKKD